MTELRVAAGAGHYVALVRDCDGTVTDKIEDDFADVAASVDHRFDGTPFSLGVTGGFLKDHRFDSTDKDGYSYINPTIGITKHKFAMSLGAVFMSESLLNPNDVDQDSESDVYPTLAMRVGTLAGPYFTMSLLSAFPMYSGGGYLDLGVGGQATDRLGIWGGVSLIGMTATGITGHLDWRLSDRFYLLGGVAFGSRDSDPQYSGTIGLSYRIVH